MNSKKPENTYFTDEFFRELMLEQVTVFLINGVKLTGRLTGVGLKGGDGANPHSFLLRRGDCTQLVRYDALASIVPERDIKFEETKSLQVEVDGNA